MIFSYQPSDPEGRLLQGEILSDLQELQPEYPGEQILPNNPDLQFSLVPHPKIVILTADCDLQTDFFARGDTRPVNQARLLQHVQCCDVYEEGEIKQSRQLGSDLWKRVRQNQDERYHRIPPQEVNEEDGVKVQHPALYLDFKRMFSIPTEFLYDSLGNGEVRRQGVIPPIWLHSLIQRYFAFHSRVGVPDPDDRRLR